MLKAEEVAAVKLPEVNVIVAPATAESLVALSPLKDAVPPTAATVVVPPITQVPWTAATVTLAVLVVAFPYWSWIATTGWIAKAAPFSVGAVGCVVMTTLAGAPAPIVCAIDVLLKPVAIT
ncbi:hypothetical protein EBZ80_24865 [bacterium]|nr:hypothetical protein [bacterium]